MKRWRAVISFSSCFSGGVFMGACLLDLIPDVEEIFKKVSHRYGFRGFSMFAISKRCSVTWRPNMEWKWPFRWRPSQLSLALASSSSLSKLSFTSRCHLSWSILWHLFHRNKWWWGCGRSDSPWCIARLGEELRFFPNYLKSDAYVLIDIDENLNSKWDLNLLSGTTTGAGGQDLLYRESVMRYMVHV